MMGEPRRIRTTKATSKRLSGQKATPAKSVGRPSGPPATIVNLRISLDLLDRLDRYIAYLEGQTGLRANRGMIARRALEVFLETHAE
jgi:hypothetical protein